MAQSAFDCVANDLTTSRLADAKVMKHEYMAGSGGRTPMSQIGDDRLSDLPWQRKDCPTTGLAGMQAEDGCSPVDILESQSYDLARAKTHPCDQENNRPVA